MMYKTGGAQWPRISVVMPSFQQAAYLRAAIESVLDQKYPEVELIVMDGGSTDGSAEIIREYEGRLGYWASAPDGGQSDALNRGLGQATGQILGWLNSDDLLEPGALRHVAETLDSSRVQWLIGVTRLVDEQGAAIRCHAGPPLTVDTFIRWGERRFSQQGVFWTRPMWEETGPARTDLHYVMDLDLWWQMFNVGSPLRTDAVLGCYRIHAAAKCQAQPDELSREYERWLAGLLTGEVRCLDAAKRDLVVAALVRWLSEARAKEGALQRFYDHAVIGRTLRFWRRFVNPRLPGPPSES